MAKRDKRIQKKKKRREKIRKTKARRRSLQEVSPLEQSDTVPDQFENHLFELLANESSDWATEPELEDIIFDPQEAAITYIAEMEARGYDSSTFFDTTPEEERHQVHWEVIESVTAQIITAEDIEELVEGLDALEARWGKKRSKSADVAGIGLIKTMLEINEIGEGIADAFAMIGLLQTITARSVLFGFEIAESFDDAIGAVRSTNDALAAGDISLPIFTQAEIAEAVEAIVNNQGDEEAIFATVTLITQRKKDDLAQRKQIAESIKTFLQTKPDLDDDHLISIVALSVVLGDEDTPNAHKSVYDLLTNALIGAARRALAH